MDSVSKDLEAKACVLENSKSPCLAGRFRFIARRNRADNSKKENFPTSFIQMLRSLPEYRKRVFQNSFL